MWVLAAKAVISTHVFEGMMGHRHGPSLLQVVIPVKVTQILSRVSIWKAHKLLLFSSGLSKMLSYSFHAAVDRVLLTRLQ